MRVVFEGVLYSRAGSVTGFTVHALESAIHCCHKEGREERGF